MSEGEAAACRSVVIDLHTHGPGFVPSPFTMAWRAATLGAGAEVGFAAVRDARVTAVVAAAVGDPVVTRCYLGRNPWAAVEQQLARAERQLRSAGGAVVRTVDELLRSRRDQRLAVLLGVEGADALAGDVDRVDAWQERGVRVVGLVHLGDNALGTTSLPWQRYLGPLPVRRTAAGLTRFGIRVVRRMNELGMLVDVAHCDRPTLLGVVDAAAAPVVASHTGARALQDFARYLSDDELRAVASTGGLVGLWPYRSHRVGVRDVAGLVDHARHIAEVVGPEHLALGTDLNGVPAVMAGYHGPNDLPKVSEALRTAGFRAADVAGILGENALRVLREVEDRAHRPPA